MTKVLFLVFHTLSAHSGISKKILAQVEGLKQSGVEASLCCLEIASDGSKARTIDGQIIHSFGKGLRAKILKRVSYSDIVERAKGYDLIYIRYDINADPFTVNMIRRLHALGAKIAVEIPTWPYDGEFRGQGLMMNLQLATDKLFRKSYFSYCDRVVLYSGPETLFGRKVTHISNGVDFDRVPLSQHSAFDGSLRLLSVANIHLWHGLDRLIRGMAEHRDQPCELHIVGDGLRQIIDGYAQMAEELGISDRVKILGPMFGKELEKEFDWANMAVGSLGRHRSGISNIKTLKNREYAARGHAFFYSECDDDFDSAPYVFKVPADESPIDTRSLASFMSEMKMSPEEIRQSVKGLSWQAQMAKIIADIS